MIFHGADDLWLDEAERWRLRWRFLAGCMLAGLIAILVLYGLTSLALAQQAPSNCSALATGTASKIAFPAPGDTGPSFPSQFLTISNPSATVTLWVCVAKNCVPGVNGAGSIALSPTGGVGQNGLSWWKGAFPPPAVVSIMTSGGTSGYTCIYE